MHYFFVLFFPQFLKLRNTCLSLDFRENSHTSVTTVYFYMHTKETNSSEILDLWIGLRVEDFVPNLCA